MKDATSHPITLDSDKGKCLEEMVKQHRLSDMGKAGRCLIDYARSEPGRQADIFTEFRCHDC